MQVALFDIDGTLADCSHRLPLIKDDPPDWDAFHDACDADKPIHEMLFLARIIRAAGFPVALATGRPERSRQKTERWLGKHGVQYCALYMRKDDDHRPDFELKREMLASMRATDLQVLFVVEDRLQCVRMFREQGLLVLHCAEGDY